MQRILFLRILIKNTRIFGILAAWIICVQGLAAELPTPFARDIFDVSSIHDESIVTQSSGYAHPRHRLIHFKVHHYDLDLTIDPFRGSLSGQTVIHGTSLMDGLETVSLDAVNLRIGRIETEHGEALNYSYNGELLTIHLNTKIEYQGAFTVKIIYQAPTPHAMHLSGPDAYDPHGMVSSYTFSQPEGARSWFPCLDRPESKSSFSSTLRVPLGFKALANGHLVRQVELAGLSIYSYNMDVAIPSYLLGIVVGPFATQSIGTYHGIPLTVWSPPAMMQNTLRDTSRTAFMMDVFSKFTGVEFPFKSYTQAVVPGYKTSMEYPTSTTLGAHVITGDGSGESVIAHELAHQWFGDLVTCRTWGEVWLNEGFARLFERIFYEMTDDKESALLGLKGSRDRYLQEVKTKVRALSEPNPLVSGALDKHAYDKGSLVLEYLRFLTNRIPIASPNHGEPFGLVMKDYLSQHAFSSATSYDLQKSFEMVTGQSFQAIFDQWVRSPGHPVVKITPKWSAGNLALEVVQDQAIRNEKAWRAFAFPLVLDLIAKDGTKIRKIVELFNDNQTIIWKIEEEPVAVVANPTWIVPGEFQVIQGREAWINVLRFASDVTAQITALESLNDLESGIVSSQVVQAVSDQSSSLVKAMALDLWTSHVENLDYVSKLWLLTSSEAAKSRPVRDRLAKVESWLVKNTPQSPSIGDIARFKERYKDSSLVSERQALADILLWAEPHQATMFVTNELARAGLSTRERVSLIDSLMESQEGDAVQIVSGLLASPSTFFVKSTVEILDTHKWKNDQIVKPLLSVARNHRNRLVRVKAIDLLSKQSQSASQICPTLSELRFVKDLISMPKPEEQIGVAAQRAYSALSCH